MDISALLTANDGVGKAGHTRPGKPQADGAFAEQLSLAAHGAGLAQLLSANASSKSESNNDADLPDELAALAQQLIEGIDQATTGGDGQAAALALIEGVLDEASGEALDEAPLAALEALLDASMQRQGAPAATLELDASEESALLTEVRQRMALIDAAGKPLAEPGQGLAKPPPGAEPAALLARATAQLGSVAPTSAEARPLRSDAEALLLDPAATRDARPTGRDALAEIAQQALRSAAQAAPAANLNANPGGAGQATTGQPQQGGDAPLLAALSGRGEAPVSASGDNQGMLAATTASAQGTTASPQPFGQPLATPSGATLAAPVASQQWQQQLGQQLVKLTQRGDQRVELRLNPAELGPLSVSLKLGESGAQAQFLSANAQVRAAVEQAIPQLREALEEQGISLGEAMVGEHASGQQGEMQFANGGAGNRAGGQMSDGEDVSATGDDQVLAAGALHLDGRVDLYA